MQHGLQQTIGVCKMSYDVKIFKLVTGEELLAKVEESAPDGDFTVCNIKDARTLAYTPDGSPSMMPFIQMAPNKDAKLHKSAIIAEVYPVDSDLEKKYLSDTSGIIL